MKLSLLFSVFAAGALPAALVAAAPAPVCSLVPGWAQEGPARSYTADNLFEYMDGNAEGYLIYQFVKMDGVTCKKGDASIVFDVSEMSDPETAYGMFTANRDTRLPTQKIGMGGQIQPRKAVFAKDKYYVEFSATPENADALKGFVAAFEKGISGRTELPDAFSWFPAEKLAADSVRLVPESVLGLRLLKRGYIAQYDFGKAFIVREATPESAAGVMEKLKARIGETQPAKIADDAFQATDKYLGKMCVVRKGRYLAGFAGIADGQDAAALTAKLAAKIQ